MAGSMPTEASAHWGLKPLMLRRRTVTSGAAWKVMRVDRPTENDWQLDWFASASSIGELRWCSWRIESVDFKSMNADFFDFVF
jgi:hypothetical protein